MSEKEAIRKKDLPLGYAQISVPTTGVLVPLPPDWLNHRPLQQQKDAQVLTALIMPVSEYVKEFPQTYLTINVLPRFYKQDTHGDAEEFLKSNFASKMYEKDEEPDVSQSVVSNGQFLSISGEMKSGVLNLSNPDEAMIISRSVYKRDVVNTDTGTYYTYIFHSSFKKMGQFLPVVRFMVNNVVHDPLF